MGRKVGSNRDVSDTSELIGRVFDDRYQITELIGRGGMGAVYKAIHIAMNQVVALKVLARGMATDEMQVQRFYQEARASSRLRHPNTIKVFDFGRSEDGHLYLAMEYLEGQTLTQLLRKEKVLGASRALKIAKQIAKSLGEAHMNGLVHRDLKPDNVFITRIYGEEDFVKVLDFGIAKSLEGSPEHERLTQAGLVCGTPLYISPEQALGKSLDGRADLYALGVILYETLCGSPPFRADTPVALVMRHIHDPPPPMSRYNPNIDFPESLKRLIFSLLEKDRDRRPRTAEDVINLIDHILATEELPETLGEAAGQTAPLEDRTLVATPAAQVAAGGKEDEETRVLAVDQAADLEAPTTFLSPSQTDQAESDATVALPSVASSAAAVPQTGRSAVRPAQQRKGGAGLLAFLAGLLLAVGAAAGGYYFVGRQASEDTDAAKGEASPSLVPNPTSQPASIRRGQESRPSTHGPGEKPTAAARQAKRKETPKELELTIETVPTGAWVKLGDRPEHRSPLQMKVRAGDPVKQLVIRAKGYRDMVVPLDPQIILAAGKTVYRYELTKLEGPQASGAARKSTSRKKRRTKRHRRKLRPKPTLDWE